MASVPTQPKNLDEAAAAEITEMAQFLAAHGGTTDLAASAIARGAVIQPGWLAASAEVRSDPSIGDQARAAGIDARTLDALSALTEAENPVAARSATTAA